MALGVGQLYRNATGVFDGYPPFTQPGGPGTIANPQQTINERTGPYFSGCGHSFHNWLLIWANLGSGLVALVCCPICTYIQNMYTPAQLKEIPIVIG